MAGSRPCPAPRSSCSGCSRRTRRPSRSRRRPGRWPRPIPTTARRPASSRCGCVPGSTRTGGVRPSCPRSSTPHATWPRCPTPATSSTRSCAAPARCCGADVAYLTLHDPERGDTYMRATAGSVSARFQALRLPLGAGLGGLVAQTRRPYWSADYPADEQFRHTNEIDAAVDDEGLIGICGTPLLVGDEFVGVLFASNRSRRRFHHDEVALLGSLAALAAVSLVQSRRAAATAATLAALSTAHEGIAQAAAAHDRFVGVVLAGGGVDDITAVLGEVLDCWVAVLDVDGSRLAAHGPVPGGHGRHPANGSANGSMEGFADPLADAPAVRHSAETGRLAEADGMWAVAVTAAGQRLGTLVLGGCGGLDAGQGRTVERAAMVTARGAGVPVAGGRDGPARPDRPAHGAPQPDPGRGADRGGPGPRRARPRAGPAAADPACAGGVPVRRTPPPGHRAGRGRTRRRAGAGRRARRRRRRAAARPRRLGRGDRPRRGASAVARRAGP